MLNFKHSTATIAFTDAQKNLEYTLCQSCPQIVGMYLCVLTHNVRILACILYSYLWKWQIYNTHSLSSSWMTSYVCPYFPYYVETEISLLVLFFSALKITCWNCCLKIVVLICWLCLFPEFDGCAVWFWPLCVRLQPHAGVWGSVDALNQTDHYYSLYLKLPVSVVCCWIPTCRRVQTDEIWDWFHTGS